MNGLQDQLDKMLKDYSKLDIQKEQLFDKTMKDVDGIKDKEQADFLRQSLVDAKNGKLDITSFMKNIENRNKS